MVCFWYVYGVFLVCFCCVSHMFLICFWCVSGLCLVCFWCVSGVFLVCFCYVSFVFLVCFWCNQSGFAALGFDSVWLRCTRLPSSSQAPTRSSFVAIGPHSVWLRWPRRTRLLRGLVSLQRASSRCDLFKVFVRRVTCHRIVENVLRVESNSAGGALQAP